MEQKSSRHLKQSDQSDNPVKGAASLGSLGEMMVALELMIKGWAIYTQFIGGSSSSFDLLAVKGDLFKRIQVKSTARDYKEKSRKSKKHILKVCKRSKGKFSCYSSSDCDFIVIVLMDEGRFFVIPTEKFSSKTVNVYTNEDGVPTGWTAEYQDAWDLMDE